MAPTNETIDGPAVVRALGRVAAALQEQHQFLTELDAAVGDGDLGITATKMSAAITEYIATPPSDDLGKYLASAGMAINRVASSTLGTILTTGLMRAGKEARGLATLDAARLAAMLKAADLGIQERGGAKPGDKTLVDALHPAAEAFGAAVDAGDGLREAGQKMLAAAEAGRDSVTALRSKIGRSAWVGERTEGRVDPGCAALVIMMKAVLES
jgi:dihydroxyacetone kinase